MDRFPSRFRCCAALLALALAVAPLASAAPAAPALGSWWSSVAAGFDGLLGLFGLGGTDTVTAHAEEGPGLEPDGSSILVIDGTGGTDDSAPTGGTESGDGGGLTDPNG